MNNIDEYQKLAVRTAPTGYKPLTKQQMDLVHAVLGLSSELGELASTIKAHVIYGKPLDEANIEEEAGDLEWYVALLHEAIGYVMSLTLETNIAKLRKRYPDGYSDQAALARADKAPAPTPTNEPQFKGAYLIIQKGYKGQALYLHRRDGGVGMSYDVYGVPDDGHGWHKVNGRLHQLLYAAGYSAQIYYSVKDGGNYMWVRPLVQVNKQDVSPALVQMAVASHKDAEAHGTDSWPTLEEVEQECKPYGR